MDREPAVIDLSSWDARLAELAPRYRSRQPFPHVVLDDLLRPEVADRAARDFPDPGDPSWFHFFHFNSRKQGLDDPDLMPELLRRIVASLNSRAFVDFLEGLTGIEGLLADPSLDGGGLHLCSQGGFLNVHTDFTVHPRIADWRRRVNVLLYLNPGWREEYGGALELWSPDMARCEERILPLQNRCVVLGIDGEAYHGHPTPLACPPSTTRKSIALYYFTQESQRPVAAATRYRVRPADRGWLRRTLIRLDGLALRAYKAVVRRFGLRDDLAGRLLAVLGRRRR